MTEITPYPGNPNYGVTRDGRVFRLKPWRFGRPVPFELSQWIGKNGYLYVGGGGRSGLGRAKTVHRMVAETFVPNPKNLPQVAHRDGVRSNANASNLRWDTCAGNMADTLLHGTDNRGQKHSEAILSNADVVAIRSSSQSGQHLAAKFGVSRNYVYEVKAGRARIHG
jgi:hypothetical protein